MANPGMSTLGWMQGAGALVQLYGAMQSGKAARAAGDRAKVAAEFDAWQANRAGGQAMAVAQRQAREELRQADLQASRALAVAAASGGGVSDPTIVRLLANVRGEGVYRSHVALYEGEARARDLRLSGGSSRVAGAEAALEGVNRQTGALYAGFGSAVRTGASLYEKYGGSGAPANPAAGGLDQYELFSGAGMTDPRYG